MAKYYDPIMCMMVEKPEAKKANDAEVESPRSNKKYKIYGDVVTLKSITSATVTYETSNGYTQKIGRRKWNELAVKVTDAAATVDKAIKVMDASLPEWLVTAESDSGRHVEYTTRKATAAEAKAEAEKSGFNNVQVRKY